MEGQKEEEYELIPLSPLRKLEKRIEELEKKTSFSQKEFYKDLVDIIRINQQIVNEVVKANDSLRIELARIPPRIEELVEKLDELLGYIKEAASEEVKVEERVEDKGLIKKIEELIETNKRISDSLSELASNIEELQAKLKRPLILPRKPLIPKKPL